MTVFMGHSVVSSYYTFRWGHP